MHPDEEAFLDGFNRWLAVPVIVLFGPRRKASETVSVANSNDPVLMPWYQPVLVI